MRDVVFQKVRMENYGPYIDPMEIEFKNNKLIMITGPNGVGKTLMIDSISYALFGITSKGAGGDDVVNNEVGKNCKVSLDFTVDGEKYNITRYQKYKSLGNTVILKRGKERIKKGQREVLPMVEQLTTHRKLFPNTIMFGQKIKDFFTDLTDTQKKSIFRIVLSLDKWVTYYEKAKNKAKILDDNYLENGSKMIMSRRMIQDLKENIDRQKQLKQNFYNELRESIKELNEKIETSSRLLQKWREKLLSININPSIEELSSKIAVTNNNIQEIDNKYNSRYSKLEQMKSDKKSEIKEKASEAIEKVRQDVSEEIEKLNIKLEEVRKEREDTALRFIESKNGINRNIDRTEDNLANEEINRDEVKGALQLGVSKCPTCKQEIKEESQKHLKIELEAHENKILEFKRTLKEYREEKKELIKFGEKEISRIDSKAATIVATINEVKAKTHKREAEIKEKMHIALRQVDRAAQDAMEKIRNEKDGEKQNLQNEYVNLTRQLREAEEKTKDKEQVEEKVRDILNEKNSFEREIENLKRRKFDETTLNDEKDRLKRYQSELKYLENQSSDILKKLECVKFWKDAYSSSGIPSMLIDEAIPFMNTRVQYYLDKISNGRYVVSFDTLSETKKGEIRDKISVNFLDTKTKANSRVQLSGGQTRVVDIATILTLGELQENIQKVKFNVLLFDEVFDSLDDENIGQVSKVLRKLVENKSVVIISHRHIDQIESDEVLAING